ncbi:DUF1294 domain-containing protein [Schlegelella sp. S2-27]|uniref:DUF1294 domain-containing protein n=1 Tax=Caldimonas mangrovi TaxID=2944811 RepID=A0ABT0YHC1_9BURK|nr:DUF1294 domain-containing protein [Caldimonas mangrovi]MCM5678088.1 DUF1294 domain-containing protein [Caldimonas mangrovi]
MRRRAQAGHADLGAVAAFALLYAVAVFQWQVPGWTVGIYIVASATALWLYAADKHAAMRGRWRVPEATLLWVGLACGWPGAIMAQRLLRHKTRKTSFQAAFAATVALNVAGFVLLATPAGRSVLGW